MTPGERGRFCTSCKKTVMDFSLMTDEQLVNFFKNNKSDVCGKFYTDQLNKDFAIPKKKIPFLKYFFRVSIPAFLFSIKAGAQTTKLTPGIIFFDTKKIIDQYQKANNIFKIISGVVIDPGGHPIPGASVMIRNSAKGVSADSLGKFTIELQKNEQSLEFSAIGYSTVWAIPNNSNMVITMDYRSQVMLGAIVTGYRVKTKSEKKKSVLSTHQNKITVFSVYPNPIPLYSNLNIKWEKPVNADQLIEIFDVSGALIQRENIIVQDKLINQSIYLKMIRTGMYVIKITDNKSRKFQSANFIVE